MGRYGSFTRVTGIAAVMMLSLSGANQLFHENQAVPLQFQYASSDARVINAGHLVQEAMITSAWKTQQEVIAAAQEVAKKKAAAAALAAAQLKAQQQAQQAPAQQQVPPPSGSGIFSYAGLEALWEANGGSAGTAATAACIAEHESSGNPVAFNGRDIGLWQIDPIHDPNGNLYNPSENARVAVAVSGNGTNWSQWTTAPDCGV